MNATEEKNLKFIVNFLNSYGIFNTEKDKKVDRIVSGFDLNRPVYTTSLEPDDRIFQFLRNEESSNPVAQTGNWFCISKATSKDALAIFDGAGGRRLQEFIVQRHIQALEGTAKRLSREWSWAGGGAGGATQLYLPPQALMSLAGVGTHFE